jgi:hypothetical protein
VLISPTFNVQLLCTQIPKAKKYTVNLPVFFVLLGSVLVKSASKILMKLTPEVDNVDGDCGMTEKQNGWKTAKCL